MIHLARKFAGSLKSGDVCLLYGELGAGKTFFTSYVVEALGGDLSEVNSPTFNLIHQYDLPDAKFYHVDLYRVKNVIEEDDISQDLWMNPGNGFSFIEWAERLQNWRPPSGYKLNFTHMEKGRTVQIERL